MGWIARNSILLALKPVHYFRIWSAYRSCEKTEIVAKNNTAVILHLYYPEMWPYFRNGLLGMGVEFDLYITTPMDKKSQLPADLPVNTTVFFVPNHGRDILPFFYVVRRLADRGYTSVLKLHTKKSPHFDGGDKWRDELVGALTNSNTTAILAILENKGALVGPKGQYMSLEVNFEANGAHLEHILTKKLPKREVYRLMQSDRGSHGFFAGSMFWVSYQYISNSIFQIPFHRYESEEGQVDGTMAHALERAITLIAEGDGLSIWETDGNNISKVAYDQGIIPEWSDKFVKPT